MSAQNGQREIMNSRTKLFGALAAVLGVVLLYGGWLAVRAHRNLVTLNVRNMDVRQVVKKIQWQTWEIVQLHKDVQGKVTLRVHDMPLEQVLRMVGEQTFANSSVIYPLYSSGKSLAALKKALRGEIDPAVNGWTNLQNRAAFRGGPGGPGGMFGGGMAAAPTAGQPRRVSLQIQDKDAVFAALAFGRYAQTRVVPEDGTTTSINLTLNQATVPDAVAQLAKKAHRSWTKLYTIRAEFGPGGPGGPNFAGGPGGPGGLPFVVAREPDGPNRRDRGGPEMTDEQRDEMRKQRAALEEELRQALPAEERQKLEQAQAEREKQMQEMRDMTPEQRAQRFSQMGGPMGGPRMDKMMRDRVLTSTPEQRARMMGPGGPGRGPGGRGPGG